MEFINRNVLWLLPVVVLWSLLWWIYGDSKRRMVLKNYMRGQAVIMVSYTKRFWRRALLLAGLVLLTLAAARPCWGERPLEFNVSQTDVLIVFDVSRSMLAEDVAPSRLEHGKWLLRELIKKNPRAAFGIVPFAGRAYLACPVTGDRVSLEQSIEELNCDVVPVGGTNLSAALQTAIKALKAAKSTVREIVLITDGEELTGDISKVLDDIKKSGIRLLVLGLGDPAVPALIPETDAQNQKHFKRDSAGELVRTRLNEELLRKVASATGGIYINSNALNTGLEQISAELAKNDSENSRLVRRSLPIERFMIFLAAGSLLVILSLLIDEKGARRRLNIFLAIGCCLALCENAPAQDSTAPRENGSAEIKLDEPFDAYKVYNQARKLQLAGNAEPAAELYNQLNKPDAAADVRGAALHNSGVIAHTAGRLAFAESVKKARSGNLDEALKELDGVEKSLNRSGEFYINTMQLSADDSSEVQKLAARNQQQMLLDMEEVKKFRKTLEDLKKMQQQAQQQTQQAQQKNQQQQQKGQGKQDQQQQQGKQDQQQQNQQQQDQQSGSDAQKSLQDAQQKVEDLQKKSANVSPAMSEQAKKAAEDLKNAQEKQSKGDYSGAEKDISEALKKLGQPKNSDKQDKKSGKDGEKGKEDQGSGDKNKDKKEQSGKDEAGEQEQNKMDARQSDALLQLMGQDEKKLRDAIKRNRQNRIAPVEKDW